ncbi:MAG: hypothetical protein ABUL57_03090, partial [Chloroflexota bacterium]
RKYQATAKILVNSSAAPYLRTQQLQVTPQQPRSEVVRGSSDSTTTTTVPAPATVVSQAPDTETLVTAANLYPQLILSDQVAALSPAPPGCKVDASGIFASTNTFGVFKASPVPVLKVVATCDSNTGVIRASKSRVVAFQKWIVKQQQQAKIPKKQRIVITELQAPVKVATVGSPSAAMPVFVGLAIFLVFCLLAVRLGRPTPVASPAPPSEQGPSQAKTY